MRISRRKRKYLKQKKNYLLKNTCIVISGHYFKNYIINIYILFLRYQNINPSKAKYFGYDQVLFTLLVSKKKFASIGLKLEQCTQRVCFMSKVKYNLNTTKIIYQENICSPIVLHKSIPINWKTLK